MHDMVEMLLLTHFKQSTSFSYDKENDIPNEFLKEQGKNSIWSVCLSLLEQQTSNNLKDILHRKQKSFLARFLTELVV